MKTINVVDHLDDLTLAIVAEYKDYVLVKPNSVQACNAMGMVLQNCLTGYEQERSKHVYFVFKAGKIVCALETTNIHDDDHCGDPECCGTSEFGIAQLKAKKNSYLARKHSKGVEALIKQFFPEMKFDIETYLAPKKIKPTGKVITIDHNLPLQEQQRLYSQVQDGDTVQFTGRPNNDIGQNIYFVDPTQWVNAEIRPILSFDFNIPEQSLVDSTSRRAELYERLNRQRPEQNAVINTGLPAAHALRPFADLGVWKEEKSLEKMLWEDIKRYFTLKIQNWRNK